VSGLSNGSPNSSSGDASGDASRRAPGLRMREIAAARLGSARAMRVLAERQPSVLAAVDAAARGEMAQIEAEELLLAHLSSREACIASMRAFDGEWRELARDASAWSDAETDEIQSSAREFLAVIAEIEASDAVFARALADRRGAARDEITRTDSGRAANRAYGAPRGDEPRFTDRRG